MDVDVVVRGDREAADLVGRLAQRLADGRPALRGLVDQLTEAERDRFVVGRGRRWRRLAASTIRRKREEGADARPLILTGALMESLSVPGAAHQIVRVYPNRLQYGTSIWYARFHQKGEGVARRTVVGLTRVQKQSLVAELRRVLIEDR